MDGLALETLLRAGRLPETVNPDRGDAKNVAEGC